MTADIDRANARVAEMERRNVRTSLLAYAVLNFNLSQEKLRAEIEAVRIGSESAARFVQVCSVAWTDSDCQSDLAYNRSSPRSATCKPRHQDYYAISRYKTKKAKESDATPERRPQNKSKLQPVRSVNACMLTATCSQQ